MIYRAEIDGLRALAVVPVIFFHAGFEYFGGGFVGVDVFFVISGYLITTLLIEEIQTDGFSFVKFYERRIRRILPALFFVTSVCIPFAWMWMSPSQMKDFSQSLVALSLFSSNIFFWQKSDYFDPVSHENPLLHTWSLALEEQYYMFFPLVLYAVWRYGKNTVFWVLILLLMFSLFLSEWGWRSMSTANFYLLPTRIWELLTGSLAALIVNKRGVQTNNFWSIVGLIFIIFSIFSYDKLIPFPSLYTLLPVTGAMLLILFAEKKTIVGRILSLKVLVGLGLISYSAYLWHHPIFVFSRIRSAENLSLYFYLALIFITFLLAFLSWKLIEQPFRKKEGFKKITVFVLSSLFLILFVSLGLYGHKKEGFGEGKNQTVEVNLDKKISEDIYLVGDSHAAHLEAGLRQITEGSLYNMTSPGCIPFKNVDRYDYRFKKGECAKKINEYLNQILKIESNALVILSSMGPVYLDGTTFKGKDIDRIKGLGVKLITDTNIKDRYEVFEIGMRKTLTELLKKKNLKIVFAIDVPELGIDSGCLQQSKVIKIFGYELKDQTKLINIKRSKKCFVKRNEYDERSKKYKNLVYKITNEFPDVYVFDPTDYFCDYKNCNGYNREFGYLYRDFDHLSQNGSKFFAKNFSDWILEQQSN